MIKKLIKVLLNPSGALVDGVTIIVKTLIKEFTDDMKDKIDKTVKYVDEPNELDMGLDAIKDMVMSQQREIDELIKIVKKGGK
jgi:hypothetical protein